jgi:hypothetical protein
MIDSLRHTEKFSEAAILKLTQRMMDNIPHTIFRSVNNVDIIISFGNVIEKLLQWITCSIFGSMVGSQVA